MVHGISVNAGLPSDALTTTTPIASTSFEAPSGAPAALDDLFAVRYTFGVRQEILPAIADSRFYDSVPRYGFQLSTDRTTGLITIDGSWFRPDYFQMPLTSAETLFVSNNADASGVAYISTDANGDGITDYRVITSTGLQIVYGLP